MFGLKQKEVGSMQTAELLLREKAKPIPQRELDILRADINENWERIEQIKKVLKMLAPVEVIDEVERI